MKQQFVFILFFLCTVLPLKALEPADTTLFEPNAGIDFTNRYIWRGMALNSSPNLQPYADISYKNFTLGTWGSYATDGQFAEVDLFLAYSINNFNLTLTDYYTENENDYGEYDLFNYKNKVTNHALEFMVDYQLPGRFPIVLTAATIFYGLDKNIEGENLYSTWVQVAYPFSIKNYDLKVFLGGTPHESIYCNEANITELGIQFSKEITITDRFSLPVAVALITNPTEEDVFVRFNIGL
ncbi:MAG: hypothetical protein PF489_11940 [Salinivirgaceae bacterium]|jgi:hypothetical protein|nr:hypothetical protein [Salinivirgaceae bacterium]